MLIKISARAKHKSLSSALVIAFVITLLAVGGYAGSSGDLNGLKAKAATAVDHGSDAGNNNSIILDNYSADTALVATQAAQNISAANFVYTEGSVNMSPTSQTYSGPGVVENKPDRKASGKIDLPAGATVKIKEQPANGTATVDSDGKWVYTPNSGFTGNDQFTMIVKKADGSEEIKTITLKVTETQTVAVDEDNLPTSGGATFASIIALWLFVAASFSLRAGIVSIS